MVVVVVVVVVVVIIILRESHQVSRLKNNSRTNDGRRGKTGIMMLKSENDVK